MKKRLFIPLVIYLCFAAGISQASPFSATAAIEKQAVFIGESFVFQIQVSGSENPEKPDLSHVKILQWYFREDNKTAVVP